MLQIYIDYYQNHQNDFIQLINSHKNSFIKNLRKKIYSQFKFWFSFYESPMNHFEWEYNNDPFDFSGDIYPDGFISFHQPILSFLNEHTGDRTPTYCSYNGWYFPTYSDSLNEIIESFALDFLCDFFFNFFSVHFNTSLDTDSFNEIMVDCDYFDDVKFKSFLFNCLDYPSAFSSCGISPDILHIQLMGL